MESMKNHILTLVIGLASVIALVTAFTAQYGFNLQPCILCRYERIPYVIIASLSFLALLSPKLNKPLLWLIFFTLLAGTLLSLYHVGIEHHIFQATEACHSAAPAQNPDIEELRKQILEADPPSCDKPVIIFMGISFAELNFIFSLIMAIFTFNNLWRKKENE